MPVYSGNYSMKKFNKIKCFSYVFTVILALGFVLTACEKPAVTLTTPESVNGAGRKIRGIPRRTRRAGEVSAPQRRR